MSDQAVIDDGVVGGIAALAGRTVASSVEAQAINARAEFERFR